MVLGVGGGLGAGYILWEFQEHARRHVVLGFRNDWQYPARWAGKTCRRLRVPVAAHETGAARKAEAQLRAAVDQGVPAIAWVDQQLVGYRHLPGPLAGHGGYPLTVYGIDERAGVALVDDRNHARLTVPLDALAAARARIGSYRHRLLVLDAPAAELDLDALRTAVGEGLAEQVEHLSRASDSFSLPAFRKWARLLTDRRNAKAWPRVFADRAGLFDACVSVYENVEPVGPGGGNLRGLYAEFLDEAAELLGDGRLRHAAAAYRDLAGRWPGWPCRPTASRSPRCGGSPTGCTGWSSAATPAGRRRRRRPAGSGRPGTAGGRRSPPATPRSTRSSPPWPTRWPPSTTPRPPPWPPSAARCGRADGQAPARPASTA
jgi:hypothetical protein